MRNISKNFLKLIIVLPIIASLSSCVGVLLVGSALAVTSGTVYYLHGNYVLEVPQNINSAYNGVIKYLQSNATYYLDNKSISDGKSATINVTENSSSENIKISLKEIDGKSTQIKIRYGLLGNENKSADLAKEIVKVL